MQEILNDFLRNLGCVSINLKDTGLSIILYVSRVDTHFDIGQGTHINYNRICQSSHVIDISTLNDEERKLLPQIRFKGTHLNIVGMAYTRKIIITVSDSRSKVYRDES